MPDMEQTSDRLRYLNVMSRAQEIYLQRDAKYKGLWKDGGPQDSAFHAQHKASRLVRATADDTFDEGAIDDALDLVNYAVFFILNMEDRRG